MFCAVRDAYLNCSERLFELLFPSIGSKQPGYSPQTSGINIFTQRTAANWISFLYRIIKPQEWCTKIPVDQQWFIYLDCQNYFTFQCVRVQQCKRKTAKVLSGLQLVTLLLG